MHKTLVTAAALCGLLAVGGCAHPGRQTTPAPEPVAGPILERTIKGPLEQQSVGAAAGASLRQPAVSRNLDEALREEASGALKPPSLEAITARIEAYSGKFRRWNELNTGAGRQLSPDQRAMMGDCYRQMQRILADYNMMRTAVETGDRSDVTANSIYSGKMLVLQQRDLDFVESDCGRLVGPVAVATPGGRPDQGGQSFDGRIAALSTEKKYREIEQAWQGLSPQQQEQTSLDAKMLYADALVYLQKEEEAADLYRGIVGRMEADGRSPAELLPLRKILADLCIAIGRYQDAQAQYVQISKDYLALASVDAWARMHLPLLGGDQQASLELAAYSGLVRNYLGYLPEQDGFRIVWEAEKYLADYPRSSVAANVKAIRDEMNKAGDAWFSGIVAEIDRLAGAKKYQEAAAMIKAQRADMINDQQRDLLNARLDELGLAEAAERETTKMAQEQELEQRWNNGLQLVSSGRYDEAIKVFDGMTETELGARADAKIVEISSMAAREDRRKAADLFIRYTRTGDVEVRKNLLIESRRLLKGILVKYPRADITDKVLGNIQRVEQEMNAIDPNLIAEVDSRDTGGKVRENGWAPAYEPDDPFGAQPQGMGEPARQ
ncbi:hypothetical protein JWG42_04245 [Desulfoprunum benzoelyticum]|uniref:Uncharacterized protein n=1 Tax=Desulfoprunum benzoelyticum TaxID=1506996 RepID=A0A840V1P5_9BACT|nr:hypothetical protein [Desulfoprunum benzoelyticum]MBB5347770.1 hypothetical protein [Desulfoprunum benzoelyticum]MBM9529361.1 hypothetical protein [Desulfoprunum benzoelyticum]